MEMLQPYMYTHMDTCSAHRRQAGANIKLKLTKQAVGGTLHMRLTFDDTHGETVSTEDTLNHIYPDSQQHVSQGKQQTLVSGLWHW